MIWRSGGAEALRTVMEEVVRVAFGCTAVAARNEGITTDSLGYWVRKLDMVESFARERARIRDRMLIPPLEELLARRSDDAA